jgi:hypothetical protein
LSLCSADVGSRSCPRGTVEPGRRRDARARRFAPSPTLRSLGTPISIGTLPGSIRGTNDSEAATLSSSASSPRASGVVFLQALKERRWSITTLAHKFNRGDTAITLINAATNNSTRSAPLPTLRLLIVIPS